MPHYLMSLIAAEPDFSEIDPAEMQETMDAMEAYNKELEAANAMVLGGGLQQLANSRTVRFSGPGDSVVTDGPFAETKEQLAGFWIIRADSTEDAVEWARKVPLGDESAIEVRPFAHDVEADSYEGSAEDLLRGTQGG